MFKAETAEYLTSCGVRPSPQRVAVMEYLMTHHTHPTVDAIYAALSGTMPTLSRTTVYNTLKLLVDEKSSLCYEDITHREDISKVSIVGAGMVNNPGVAAKMFEALYDAGINIHMISTSETKVSVLINVKNAERAVQAIHEKFNI